jgi:Zn-finger nucleic acid-binding protein
MECPECHAEMRELEYGQGLILDTCDFCYGLWLDSQETTALTGDASAMTKLAKKLPLLRAPGASSRNLQCPRCNKGLIQTKYPEKELLVDICPNCLGMWLDKGEISILLEQARRAEKKQETTSFTIPTGQPSPQKTGPATPTKRLIPPSPEISLLPSFLFLAGISALFIILLGTVALSLWRRVSSIIR